MPIYIHRGDFDYLYLIQADSREDALQTLRAKEIRTFGKKYLSKLKLGDVDEVMFDKYGISVGYISISSFL
jgi:hypothetical protein